MASSPPPIAAASSSRVARRVRPIDHRFLRPAVATCILPSREAFECHPLRIASFQPGNFVDGRDRQVFVAQDVDDGIRRPVHLIVREGRSSSKRMTIRRVMTVVVRVVAAVLAVQDHPFHGDALLGGAPS
eukprot:CAMPEP_0197186260 /NCGR_PEP_ID=MMETSP1423-20130617/13567_1 /TAXON_ID=476441 /ORGANISM="Pseudo-nitzschia heimii, Strain UNC1101" /LENGTH=129 /DNA_ID=CAMNT_0042637523 /DNA_START=120 /DNA_END=506 /DNA_ORIENTATION=-